MTVVGDDPVSTASERPNWEDLEPNPWKTSVRPPGSASGSRIETDGLSGFQPEGATEERARDMAKSEEPTDEVPAADIGSEDQAGQRAAVVTFRAAVSEARAEAEHQLVSAVQGIRKTAAEKHSAELARIADRHAKELQRTRETIEADVTKRVREEESQRHAAEVARIREEFERRNAADLQVAQTTAVESFKSLTTNFSGT